MKTALDLGPGVTCVVGPNGAGKSNILEALRWVMGEQRVKSLRSRKMDDVIFNGSETLKPLGLAEVRLVLSNLDRTSNSAFRDYDEIMVSRRLFRDGASHYEINNVPCRLSDIVDFFLDTGVGKNSYAIIEQGRVEQIVAAKPEDRRLLIEEAAGVNKYKARKEIALKKLEATSQNLLRISDIILEVKSQSLALKRQAQKAERFQKLTEKLRYLEFAIISAKVKKWNQKLLDTMQGKNSLKAELERSESLLSRKSADLEKNKLIKLKLDTDYSDLVNRKHKLELDLRSVRENSKRSAERLLDVGARLENIESEVLPTEQNRDQSNKNLGLLDEALSQTRQKLTNIKLELEQTQSLHSDLNQSIFNKRRQFNVLRDDLFRSLQDSAVAKNRKESLQKRKTELQNHAGRKLTEKNILEKELASTRENIALNRKNLSKLVELLADTTKNKTRFTSEKNLLESEIQIDRSRVHEVENRQTATHAKLRTLEELQESYAGYENPIKFIMKNRGEFNEGITLEPIGEIIDIAESYHKALAATLRDRIDMVVSPSVRDSVKLAERLKLEKTGRASFVPKNPRLSSRSNVPESLPDAIPMIELVKARPGFEEIAQFLFQDVFVCKDLGKASEIWERNGTHLDLVTEDGDFISRHGEVSGGSDDVGGEEIFRRRKQINQLKDQRRLLVDELGTAKNELEQKKSRLQEIKTDLNKSSEEVNRLKMEELRFQSSHENLNSKLSNGERHLQALQLDESRFEREISQINQELGESDAQAQSYTEKNRLLEAQKDKLQSEINILNQKNSDRQSKIESLKIQSAKLNERLRSSEREIQAVRETISSAEKQIVKLNSEKEKGLSLKKQLSEDIESLNLRQTELMVSHEKTVMETESLKSQATESQKQCSELEAEVQELNKSVRINGQKLHELEVEQARLEENIRNANEQIDAHYNDNPEKFLFDHEEASESLLEEVKQKVESFGPVNLAAIAESKTVDERLGFLSGQKSDLEKALETLHETINTINQTTRDRFMETFEKVNEQFRDIFPFLFGGGQARLELTDSANPLETGVAIMVRPPGKRYQNMDLLSGGEKALTAVALIFSIFLISPSPFCLLDEVDAPLDDSNLSRFNSMLRKLSVRTQFIVVTHNKKSMEESDALFGVTMEEPGASKVVSVKFVN